MQISSLGAIEIQTEVGYWLMSGTEEVRSWVTWLGSTRYIYWRCTTSWDQSAQSYSEDTVLKHNGFFIVQLVIFFRKIKAWEFYGCGFRSPRVGSAGLWPLLFKGPHTQKGPHLCSPCLKMPSISWTRGPKYLFCVPHIHFSLAPTIWVGGPWFPVEC